MVPSITDVWGYDREFCSSSSSSSSTHVTQKPKKHKLMKFCKNIGIYSWPDGNDHTNLFVYNIIKR